MNVSSLLSNSQSSSRHAFLSYQAGEREREREGENVGETMR